MIQLQNMDFYIIHFNCINLIVHCIDVKEYLHNIVVKYDVVALSDPWLIPDKHTLEDYKLKVMKCMNHQELLEIRVAWLYTQVCARYFEQNAKY